jgi:hypothetical protein
MMQKGQSLEERTKGRVIVVDGVFVRELYNHHPADWREFLHKELSEKVFNGGLVSVLPQNDQELGVFNRRVKSYIYIHMIEGKYLVNPKSSYDIDMLYANVGKANVKKYKGTYRFRFA